MVSKTKLIVGFLTVILLSSGVVYIQYLQEVKIRVDSDKTTLYVFEDSRWKVGGREYNKLFDGTRQVYRDLSKIKIETNIHDNMVIIKRTTPYKRTGTIIIDTYLFRGDVRDKKMVPIEHKVEVINGSGLFYRYEIRDLTYSGETYKLSRETYLSFGKNVVVRLHPNYRWAWVYKSGIVKAQYDIKSDYEVFYVKLFDPNASTTTLTLDGLSSDRYYEHGTVAILKANVTNSTGDIINDTICLDINQVGYGDNYICGNGTVEYNLTANAVLGEFNDSTKIKNLTYTNAPENKTFYVRLNRYDEVQSAYINLTGYENPSYPLNIKIYVNNSLVDSVSGYLGAGNHTLDEFNNSNTAENLTFNGAGIKTRYLKLPENSNVTSAYLDVTGYYNTVWSSYYDVEDSYSCDDTVNDCSYAVDENWGTEAYVEQFYNGNVYENSSSPYPAERLSRLKWYFKVCMSSTSQQIKISFWNYNTSGWEEVWSVGGDSAMCGEATIIMDSANYTSPLQVKTYLYNNQSFTTSWVGYFEGKVSWETYNYSTNPYIDSADSGGIHEWNWSGEFTPDNGTQTVNLNATLINNYLSNCTADSEGYCNVPVLFYSSSAGILEVSNIEINYTYIINSTRNINTTVIDNYLSAQSSGYHNVPIKISSETNSTIQISNINIIHYGSDNITVTAHFDGNADYSASNDAQIIEVVYSNFNISNPFGYPSTDLVWMPVLNSSKNVTPWGQTDSVPGWNITSLAYDQPFNLSVKVNESYPSCINMTVDGDNTKAGGILLNTSYQQIITNFTPLLSTEGIWWWADLQDCNRSSMAWVDRTYYLKGCCYSCVKCE